MGYAELSLAQKAMYDESSVAKSADGRVSLHLPTVGQLQRKHPHLTIADGDWRAVSTALMGRGALVVVPGGAQNKAPARANASGVPAGARTTPPCSPRMAAQGLEARIRELRGPDLGRVSALNKVRVEVHTTNPGITAMRRKNALLTLLRRGVQVKL